ncbi:MAG: hypothetical protein Tsb0020_10390 [Haliangiales bacterium]
MLSKPLFSTRGQLRTPALNHLAAAVVAIALMLSAGCTSVSTMRLQSDTIEVGAGMRPIAGIQTNATSAYLLFVPVPGGVTLDRVVNQLLVATAKAMGADKVTDLRFEITPDSGIWTLRKLAGWRTAQASGIAVQVTAPAPDPNADLGPESPPSP